MSRTLFLHTTRDLTMSIDILINLLPHMDMLTNTMTITRMKTTSLEVIET